MIIKTGRCFVCGQESELDIEDSDTAQKVLDWMTNPAEFIQVSLYMLSVDDREQILNGTHGPCFDDIFCSCNKTNGTTDPNCEVHG